MGLTAAQKMRNRREKLRKAGLCVRCGARKARKNRVTCQKCADHAKMLVQQSRKGPK